MAFLRKSSVTTIYLICLASLLQAQQAPPSSSSNPASGADEIPGIIVGCSYYGNNYGDLPNAQACSNSNGNHPNGNLQLHNSANMIYDNNTGTFLASSSTGNAASGSGASISSYTSANVYSPVNPAPISEAQVSGGANSDGQAATGNVNNLDQINSYSKPDGNAFHVSDSQVNSTGRGMNLYSSAQANGQAYNWMTSTAGPKGAARRDKKIFFEPSLHVRARDSAHQKAARAEKHNAASLKSTLTRRRTAGRSSGQIQKSSLNTNPNRRMQRQ